jgi:hypothetical protein
VAIGISGEKIECAFAHRVSVDFLAKGSLPFSKEAEVLKIQSIEMNNPVTDTNVQTRR